VVGVTKKDSGVSPVFVAYALFAFIGVYSGVGGVLLPAQIQDYGIDHATIGLTFFATAVGFVVAGVNAGVLVERYGTRLALLGATGLFGLAGAAIANRPGFGVFLSIQVLIGYTIGALESVLNAYLAGGPRATTLLNRLHAFFGVGALLGPLVGTWMLTVSTWPAAWAVLSASCVPLFACVALAFRPRVKLGPSEEAVAARTAGPSDVAGAGLLSASLRQPAVLFGAGLLAVYVGLELGVGRWGFSYLIEARAVPDVIAGYTISAYWLGLTLGRFLISPVAARFGVGQVGLVYGCLCGVAATGAFVWAGPGAVAIAAGFLLMGFFLGPIFPTIIAAVPQLTVPRLVPTAIGVLNAGSVVGGAALPWLAGAVAQVAGAWTLAPFAIALALVQIMIWRQMVRRIPVPDDAPLPAADPALE
jgi:fucose permease